MNQRLSRILQGISLLTVAAWAPAYAQDNTDAQSDEIVVTGTSIRGIAPAGSNTVSLGEEDIQGTGATTSSHVLASIPFAGSFNTTPTVIGSNNFRGSSIRPNVRNLPNTGTAGGNPTLLLIDGHRIVGSGIIQTVPDADVLPPSALQRVEVVPGGGSAVYGADAVGGVVNYITRTSFDGFQTDVRLGFADEYESSDVTLTAGHEWDSGNLFIAYNYLQNDAIYGRDRDYRRDVNWSTPDLVPNGRTCNPGNVTASGITTGIGQAPGVINACDTTDDAAFYPQTRKDAVFASYTQDLGEHITFDLDAFYVNRVIKTDQGPLGANSGGQSIIGNVRITPLNPYYDPTYGAGSQTVNFNFEPVSGRSSFARGTTETWSVIPSLTWDLGHDWQLRALASYGRSVVDSFNPQLNAAALAAAAAATTTDRALNPYNPAATDPDVLFGDPNQGLIGIFNSGTFGYGVNELTDLKATFDGPLMTLPGGEVRLAFGTEYQEETYFARTGSTTLDAVNTLPTVEDLRNSTSFFGELDIPLVSPANGVPFINSLAVNLSARRDDYSDTGETTNPRVGLTYEPVDWLTFRANWGESFQAPSLANTSGAAPRIIAAFNTQVGGAAPGAPLPASYYKLFYDGTDRNIRPQESVSYSYGFDLRPPMIDGLEIGLTYYYIEYRDKIALPPIYLQSFYTDYPGFFLLNPANHSPELDAYLALASNGADIQALLDSNPGTAIYTAYNSMITNLGSTELEGLDLSIRYDRDTDFGAIYATAEGSYRLAIRDSAGPSLPYGPNYAGNSPDGPRLLATATVGARVGDGFRAQASVNYSGPVEYSATATGQTHVDDFYTINLFAAYDFEGTGLTDGLSLSLAVSNLTDEEPSLYTGSPDPNRFGYANGETLGRLFQIGISKQF